MPLAAFSAKVEITLPNVSKLYDVRTDAISVRIILRICGDGSPDLVLMYLPSLVRSLSEVAFSEPARSIKLCVRVSACGTNEIQDKYQHRCLDTPPIPTLQLCPPWSLRSESGGHPSGRRHSPTSATLFVPPRWVSTPTLSTLDDNPENAMTPTAPLVPVRARSPSIRVTSLQDLLDAREICHDFFSKGRKPNI